MREKQLRVTAILAPWGAQSTQRGRTKASGEGSGSGSAPLKRDGERKRKPPSSTEAKNEKGLPDDHRLALLPDGSRATKITTD